MVLCHSHRSLLSLLLLCLIAGCSGTPVTPNATQANATPPSVAATPKAPAAKNATFAAAQRFMNGLGAGELIQTVMRREMEKTAKDQPGITELIKRVFADTSTSEFADLAAGVYARHLNQADLEGLATFSETPAGSRFFKSAMGTMLAGEKLDSNVLMRQLNADDLTEIVKFSQSPEFASMQAKLPLINKEMREEGRKFGDRKLQEYMKRK